MLRGEKVLTPNAYLSRFRCRIYIYNFIFEALFKNVESAKFSESQEWQEMALRRHGVWAFIPVRHPVSWFKTNKNGKESPWKDCENSGWKNLWWEKEVLENYHLFLQPKLLIFFFSVFVCGMRGGPSTTWSLLWGNKPVLERPNQFFSEVGDCFDPDADLNLGLITATRQRVSTNLFSLRWCFNATMQTDQGGEVKKWIHQIRGVITSTDASRMSSLRSERLNKTHFSRCFGFKRGSQSCLKQRDKTIID